MQTNNELEAQRVATEFTFRKRLREMESLYSELKWQEKNVSLPPCPSLPAVRQATRNPAQKLSLGSPSGSLAGGEQ